ncbi:MAG: hypothetical protein KGL75_00005, partial [Acidobacteriota bacterium]|nr:hypothetical protein [Acidobacteriota bacterium]
QAEQSFLAARATTRLRYGENLVGKHVWSRTRLRVGPESAVSAVITTEVRERNENFSGIRYCAALDAIADGRRRFAEVEQRRLFE